MLEMAVLGLLLESPMHGYELRKRLTGLLGAFRAFSYGSLYPTLRRMQADGLLEEDDTPGPTGVKVRRARRVYRLTPKGEARFTDLVADTGPQNYTDDGFGVHLAFFSLTPAVARMRILEGRRRQVEERRESLRELLGRSGRGNDHYTRQMHELSLETSEREVQWLNKLIADEASASATDLPTGPPAGIGEEEKNSAAQHSAVPPQKEGEPDHG
ncbi:MAG: PadR family transcriptional regulator [Gordonia sp. (in: high G+C Gram-positive bacteria)]